MENGFNEQEVKRIIMMVEQKVQMKVPQSQGWMVIAPQIFRTAADIDRHFALGDLSQPAMLSFELTLIETRTMYVGQLHLPTLQTQTQQAGTDEVTLREVVESFKAARMNDERTRGECLANMHCAGALTFIDLGAGFRAIASQAEEDKIESRCVAFGMLVPANVWDAMSEAADSAGCATRTPTGGSTCAPFSLPEKQRYELPATVFVASAATRLLSCTSSPVCE